MVWKYQGNKIQFDFNSEVDEVGKQVLWAIEHGKLDYTKNRYRNCVKSLEQVAQRATIAHLSPMCQGQISFQKIQTHPSFNACSCYMKVSKGSNQKQQRKSGNTIFPIIRSIGYFLDAQGQLTP